MNGEMDMETGKTEETEDVEEKLRKAFDRAYVEGKCPREVKVAKKRDAKGGISFSFERGRQ